MIIGLTGLIGSGKSEVARVFEELGAVIIDADKIGREVVEKDPAVMYRLVLEFGDSILEKDRSLNRKRLGKLAFASKEGTAKLNAIVHPALLANLDRLIEKARQTGKNAVVDAALLIHWNYHGKMDRTIMVASHKKNRMARLRKKGLSAGEIEQRSKSQLTESELKRQSDIIIYNNADLRELRSRAAILYREIAENG